MNPVVRPPEEEWDPEYTPKSRKYYLVSVVSVGVSFIHQLTGSSFNLLIGLLTNLVELIQSQISFVLREALTSPPSFVSSPPLQRRDTGSIPELSCLLSTSVKNEDQSCTEMLNMNSFQHVSCDF